MMRFSPIVTICRWGLPPLRFWIISLIKATGAGFFQPVAYIQGKNEYSKKIVLTAQVITKSLSKLRAVSSQKRTKQFSGLVQDSSVGEEAATLEASLGGLYGPKH